MVESDQSLRCSFSKGRSHPLLRGASAKALLAYLPAAVCEDIVRRQLAHNPHEIEPLQQELLTIRAQGYAVSEGEVDWGVWGVSVPVFYKPGQAAGVITLMAPAVRVQHRHRELISATVDAATAISGRLILF